MAEIKPEKSLNFNEFPPISTQEWEEVISEDLKGKNYKKELLWETPEGVAVLPFYRREHLQDLEHITEPVHTKSTWNIVEKIEFQNPKTANSLALHALENGASGLHFSSSSSSISTKEDLELLLKDVQVELIYVTFGSGLTSPEISKWLKEICFDRNLDFESLNITFAFDLFAQAVHSGKLAKKEELVQVLKNLKSPFKFMGVNADFYGDCGGEIVQQLAFALAEGNEYLALTDELEMSVSEVAQNIHFQFSTASSFFLEIAKYRAFRLVWAQVLNTYEEGLAKRTDTFVHARTARWNKSTADAHSNIIRATTEAMSAVLGGCNAITVERFDSDFAEYSGFSSRIARNIQLILQGEAYLDKVSDAGAGSYYIEVLTDKIARESWELFQEIEKHGGFYEAVKSGFIQQKLIISQKNRIAAYEEKQSVLVGVNKYESKENQGENSVLKKTTPFFRVNDFHNVDSVPMLNIEEALSNNKKIS
ncbi:MAG: methylmalonyl-CoA mutase family protein [Balneolaceae bacterium]